MKRGLTLYLILSGLCLSSISAQRELTPEEIEQRERLRQTVLLPFKYITDFGAENGELNMLQIRPLYTLSTENWNFINRPIIPIIDINGTVIGRPQLPNPEGAADATGLGDISYTVAVEARKMKPVSVAVGLSTTFPTATEDALGSGKWSAGPALLVMANQDAWSMLFTARQIWSFAGDSQRGNVNNLAMEPIFTYNFSKQWYLITDPIILANWELNSGDRWLVPLGGGTGYRFKLREQPLDLRIEAYYNIIKSDGAPDWSMAATITFIFQ